MKRKNMFTFYRIELRSYIGILSSNIHTKYSVTHQLINILFLVIGGTTDEAQYVNKYTFTILLILLHQIWKYIFRNLSPK